MCTISFIDKRVGREERERRGKVEERRREQAHVKTSLIRSRKRNTQSKQQQMDNICAYVHVSLFNNTEVTGYHTIWRGILIITFMYALVSRFPAFLRYPVSQFGASLPFCNVVLYSCRIYSLWCGARVVCMHSKYIHARSFS